MEIWDRFISPIGTEGMGKHSRGSFALAPRKGLPFQRPLVKPSDTLQGTVVISMKPNLLVQLGCLNSPSENLGQCLRLPIPSSAQPQSWRSFLTL
jgi:hypothetical protein